MRRRAVARGYQSIDGRDVISSSTANTTQPLMGDGLSLPRRVLACPYGGIQHPVATLPAAMKTGRLTLGRSRSRRRATSRPQARTACAFSPAEPDDHYTAKVVFLRLDAPLDLALLRSANDVCRVGSARSASLAH